MNPRPIKAEPLNNYILRITFKNDEVKLFDVKPLLDIPMYQPLKNKGLFSLVKVDGMCVYWNENIDICPDMLYSQSELL